MLLKIISTTDGKYIGETLETDLVSTFLPTGEYFEITNRMKLLEGTWKIWNTNYIIEAEEILEEKTEV